MTFSSKIFLSLTKSRLAVSVVFSALAGYIIAADNLNFLNIFLLLVGGYCIVGASNSFNQIIEKDKDSMMDRTKNRPLPKDHISKSNAFWISVFLTLAGLLCLYLINYKTAFFAALSVFLYTCVYTPLKPITPLSVFVGAIPGAIPFMLGWVAATNQFGIEPGTLFMIQFFWQFPHFWSLGWMLDDDYKKAGFVMLPTGKRDKKTALQIILYIIWMIIISIFPATGLTGLLYLSIESAIIIFILGLIMLFMGINLYNGMNIVSAKRLFIYTIFYLTLVQLIYIVDKFL
ncbi:MAG: protoheme IX farnesyltransferase [Cryomorphaceae bacterium]|nr:MAG: protoheme IX farnesyltransferase [Cryomorphaceae bacterium]